MVYVFLADGFEEVEALAPIDLLRRADVTVLTVGVTGRVATGAHGIPVVCDVLLDELGDDVPEMVVLPGGMPGAEYLDNSPAVRAHVLRAHERGSFVAAICAAPMVLGKLGLLDGKSAVCYPGFEKYLDGAEIASSPVVRDDTIITARGMGAAVEFGLALVAALCGDDCADRIKNAINGIR